MNRTEPPRLATWMFEHCTTADRNEALAGDLLEGFRSGRSDGWYWRQALAACSITWLSYLRTRASLLVFAFLWSVLAPAWTAILYRVENGSGNSGAMWRMDLPFPEFSSLAVWLVSNVTFVWAGMLLYLTSHARFSRTFRVRRIAGAFALVLPLFLAIYFITFVLMNLFAFPGPVVDMRSIAPLGAVADLRTWAIVIRIPYLLTTLCALWKVAPQLRSAPWEPVPFEPIGSTALPSASQLVADLDPYTVKRFFGLMVGAGLINAMIAAFMLCRLPESHSPTFGSLVIRAITYVIVGALTGVLGAWVYWKSPSSPFREHSPIPFPLFALVCAAGWVWVPSMMIFSEQISPATALVAVIGAILLAVGLRNAAIFVFAPAQQRSVSPEPEETDLFAESLYRAPREAQGYVIAICLYAGACALLARSNLTAAALLALCAFIFSWKRTFARSHDLDGNHEYKRAAVRLACVAIPAVLVTAWALLDGVAHRNHIAQMNAAFAAGNGTSGNAGAHQKTESQSSAFGIGGYESVILWPFPEKKQITPPLPSHDSFLAPGTTHPLIIPFDGTYWYVQPPDKRPGPTAHQAHGTPLGVDIESNNSVPLFMDAHQVLGAAIPIARCREIQVEIENRDNRTGVIAMAVLLTDAASPERPALYIGQQSIVSTEPGNFSFKSVPVFETLRFSIPAGAKMRRFNEITVMLLPDIEHALIGPKIAIQRFQLFPR